jgi:hypothetical protein
LGGARRSSAAAGRADRACRLDRHQQVDLTLFRMGMRSTRQSATACCRSVTGLLRPLPHAPTLATQVPSALQGERANASASVAFGDASFSRRRGARSSARSADGCR